MWLMWESEHKKHKLHKKHRLHKAPREEAPREEAPREERMEGGGEGKGGGLFFAHEEGDVGAVEVPVVADLVLEEAAVGLFDPLGQVAEEDEGGYDGVFEHGDVFYLDVFAFVGGGRGLCYDVEQVGVEL